MFAFAAPRIRRKPSLTPMIDVVFLLLVFFMLAARFGIDSAIPLTLGGTAGERYSGPPRLIDVLPGGQRLNGRPVEGDELGAELHRLTDAPSDTIVLRPRDEAPLQRIVEVMEMLSTAGFDTLVLVE
ncbi:ExbD/TolR family protein [Pontivivens ytuae]|uniref:Biopolymer transporter ExbD n=1 Tax=Pontivivens ytuae TaxID=2789856 RepID=A0A7S9LU88_9RHOB|nr:biopolymer transporter ExbD [Pontivivens ytuae]QPH55347.1 biopolymer transporter ExbD [Pontivivens ytuae]